MAGLEPDRADGRRHDSDRARPGNSRQNSRRASWASRRRGRILWRQSRRRGKRFVVQSLEGGGWGGRPFEDGESGSGHHLSGRRAQWHHRRPRAEESDTGRGAVAAPRLRRRRQISRRARHRSSRAKFRRGAVESPPAAAHRLPALGPLEREAGRHCRLHAQTSRRERVHGAWMRASISFPSIPK